MLKRRNRHQVTGLQPDSPESRTPGPGRFITVFAIIGIILILLIVRFASIMLGEPEKIDSLSGSASPTVERGPILDRNGRILAIQTRLDTVWAWRPEIVDPTSVAAALAPALGLDPVQLQAKLTGVTGSVTIKRTISPAESNAVRDLQNEGLIEGVRLRRDQGRSYPEQALLGSTLGFVGDDGDGLAGIEYTMDPWLAPDEAPYGYGNQVFLTIDMNIQYESERIALAALEEHQADSVVLLTMDATTGDILGYAALPGYDPNHFAAYSDDQRRNRPITHVYEPGSVFKIFSVGSILQLGGISEETRFITNGIFDLVDPPIRDLANYGTIQTPGIIRLSSNVGAALASETVDERSFYTMLKLFGFDEETGIELNGEEQGLLAHVEDWSARTKPTLAIGQEIGVTALQLLSAATVYANRGVLLKPNIVDRIVTADGTVLRDYGRTPVRDVLSPQVADTVLRAMESAVIDNGTARRLLYPGLRIAAKTGTAEMIDPETGTYSDDAFLASTLAILPADNPQIIVYVAIDHPRGEEVYGGRIATPLVRSYLDYLVPYLGIAVEGHEALEQPSRISVANPELPPITDTLPDYTGLPKRVLVPLLTHPDVMVSLEGYGWVVTQDPAPGTPFTPGMELHLEFQ